MAYETFSRTGSGWKISRDPAALPAQQWRIVHEQWGTYFFATHDEARDEAFRIAFEKMKKILGNNKEELMTATILGKELLPKLNQLIELLADCDPVTRQKLLELAVAKHVMTVTEKREQQEHIINGITKHVRQIIGEY
jgi:hypothetical protein